MNRTQKRILHFVQDDGFQTGYQWFRALRLDLCRCCDLLSEPQKNIEGIEIEDNFFNARAAIVRRSPTAPS
jgi:hypothetical protein